MKILVTGAAGFIGSHVAKRLADKGFHVVGLDDMSGGFYENVPSNIQFMQGSILDQKLLKEMFANHKFDVVYHLAAYAAEGLSHFIRNFNYQNNLIGSVNLINESINSGVKRFVFTSSMAVYGGQRPPYEEDMVPLPEDPYGISKMAVEKDLECAYRTHGLNYTIFRPHNVYGPQQNIWDKYRNVAGIFMSQVLSGKPITIFGSGRQTRAFSYIDDVAIPLVECIGMDSTIGEIFNIGADQPYCIIELAQSVKNAMKMDAEIRFEESRFEVEHAHSSHKKVRQFFGHALPKPIELNIGLSKMWEWVKTVQPQRSKICTHVEVKKNMPSFWLKELQ